MAKESDEKFSKKETEDRMQAALKGARIAGHKPMKGSSPAQNSKRPKPEKPSR